MFENFESYKKTKAPGWLMGLLVVSIGAHVAFGAGLVVKEMWAAPLLDVPPGRQRPGHRRSAAAAGRAAARWQEARRPEEEPAQAGQGQRDRPADQA